MVSAELKEKSKTFKYLIGVALVGGVETRSCGAGNVDLGSIDTAREGDMFPSPFEWGVNSQLEWGVNFLVNMNLCKLPE